MIVLGVDPGTRITGYGVIETNEKETIPLDFGCIRPSPDLVLQKRYLILFNSLETLIDKYRPDAISVESQFLPALQNTQSILKLGMAKGMVLLAAERKQIPVTEFAPKQAKLAVVGRGSASKWQVQCMIQSLLRLPDLPKPEDAADALALAICYIHHQRTSICMNLSAVRSKKKNPFGPLLRRKESATDSRSL